MSEEREKALMIAIEENRDSLLTSIRRRVRDQVEAEDVLQDVFEEFIATYDLGDSIEKLGAWLATVARNKIFDRFRRLRHEEDHAKASKESPPLTQTGPAEDWERSMMREKILEAVELLPESQRRVFVAHELEGKSFEDLAQETGTSVNTLLSQKRYAVLFLRDYLKEVYDELGE